MVQEFVKKMVYKPKEIPEEVNVTSIHPLVDFAYLLGTVIVFSIVGYLGLGLVATQLVTRMSPEMEMNIGQKLISNVPTIDPEEASAKQLQYLETLLTSLQKPNSDRSIPLTIHILEEEDANAAIFPGGHILVTTALLEEAESENELAFVLAHELGHHVARDPLKGLGRSLVLLVITTTLGIGAGNSDLVVMTSTLTDLHYSRQQESAADVYALSAIINLYGHGDSSLDFFKRIQTKNKDRRGKLSAYFSTHPLTQARINYLHQIAMKKGWKMTGEVTDLPQDVFN